MADIFRKESYGAGTAVQHSIHVIIVIIQGMASSVNKEFLLPEKEKDIVKLYI